VWTGTESPSVGSTISPQDFSTDTNGPSYCASGTVAADLDFGGVGLVGYNLNQAKASTTLGTWSVGTTTGLTYDVSNLGSSELRLQIEGLAGYPSAAWCYVITNSSGTIPWSSFNTRCWDGLGSSYNGATPLSAVVLLVPGSDAYSTPFHVCLNSLAPKEAAANPMGDCCSSGHGVGCSVTAVENCVCSADSYCCSTSWDAECINEVSSVCGYTC